MTNQTFSTNAGQPTVEQIAQRAYEIWEKAGRPEGHSAEHWFQAETELTKRTIVSTSASPATIPPVRARSARQTPGPSSKSRLAAARN